MSAPKIYAVVFPIQKAQIAAWCWGSCGHGEIGPIGLIGDLYAVPCSFAPCPHLDREMDEPCGEIHGRPVHMRKLLPVTP